MNQQSQKRNGPFIIESSESKYKNPWIEVVEERVIHPNGKKGLFGVVKYGNGVSVLPMDAKGNVYLTKEFHYALGEEDIEVVSGGANEGESLEEGARRELKEELGIDAKEWTDLGYTHPYTTVVDCYVRLFLVENLSFGEDAQEKTENITIVKMSLEDAVRLVMESEIKHAPSALLILKAWKYLQNR